MFVLEVVLKLAVLLFELIVFEVELFEFVTLFWLDGCRGLPPASLEEAVFVVMERSIIGEVASNELEVKFCNEVIFPRELILCVQLNVRIAITQTTAKTKRI